MGGRPAQRVAIHWSIYTFLYMESSYVIEIEPEVRLWLMNLRYHDYLVVEYVTELTVFRKTRQRETAEVARAKRAKAVCEASHGPALDVYAREVEAAKEER